MREAVILAGGRGLRLKGQIDIPKPFLIMKEELGETLLDSQLRWLVAYEFEHVVLAVSRETFKYMRSNYVKYLNIPTIDISIEEENLGTGGGLKRALDYMEEETFYCMNVDDITFYNPSQLYKGAGNYNAVLVKKAILPFGAVTFNKEKVVTEFKEKPEIDTHVSCGHYVFKQVQIKDLLPDEGDLERELFPKLASRGLLRAEELTGKWITINTYKELVEARKRMTIG